MSDYGVITEPRTIVFRRVLPGPIERVWAYLTESEKRAKWLASGPMDLHAGGLVELHFHHADLSPEADAIPEKYKHCENGVTQVGHVIRCEPPRLLSQTWGEGVNGASEVTFELTPEGEDVLLTLTHRKLRDRDEMLSVAGGWHAHLGILVDHLNDRIPPPFWTTHRRLEGIYDGRIG